MLTKKLLRSKRADFHKPTKRMTNGNINHLGESLGDLPVNCVLPPGAKTFLVDNGDRECVKEWNRDNYFTRYFIHPVSDEAKKSVTWYWAFFGKKERYIAGDPPKEYKELVAFEAGPTLADAKEFAMKFFNDEIYDVWEFQEGSQSADGTWRLRDAFCSGSFMN